MQNQIGQLDVKRPWRIYDCIEGQAEGFNKRFTGTLPERLDALRNPRSMKSLVLIWFQTTVVALGESIKVALQTLWYGLVWYGMVWYGVVWCGVVWYV